MNIYSLKVVEIRKETEDAITLCFKQPGLRKVKYSAGQYISLIFRINGRRYIRPYSFSSCPGFDDFLEITIKRVFNGTVSNHVHDYVKVGDVLEVMEPMGDFVFDSKIANVEAVYLWGVGSGITPLISLTKEILSNMPSLKVNLIYGNRSSESTIFMNLIDELMLKYSSTFKVWHFQTNLTINNHLPHLVQGRISNSDVIQIVAAEHAKQSGHYICGPLGLKESVKEALLSINVSENNIHSEDFEIVKDPKDFQDIETQTITLKFENVCHDLEVVKGKSILESALDAGIELPYSCQTGDCNTCKATLLQGKVKMIGLKEVREDLAADQYLLCCSHPTSNNTYIEV